MDVVVAARHVNLGQRVALRLLLPAACAVEGLVERFLREGKAAARITSEHVTRVTDTGVLASGVPYVVMEYLEGSDLAAVVRQRGRLPADEVINYVLQAGEAIAEAHELGIVHRDLKPENLFLSQRADGSSFVKVRDFGVSKMEGSSTRSQETRGPLLGGSPRYMSPEQMLGTKEVDARTDIWGLGVILYELLTAKAVWDADTTSGLRAQIASTPAPLLRVTLPDASPILEDVVRRCLAKNPDQRIAGVAQLAEALRPIAPPVARESIDCIVRVARRERADRVVRIAPLAPFLETAADVAAVGSETNPHGSGGRLGTMIGIAAALAIACAVVVVAQVSSPPPETPVASAPVASPPPPGHGDASAEALAPLATVPASASAGTARAPTERK
jgi:serine/threonine-protein kinase